jgi:hypothetical protein
MSYNPASEVYKHILDDGYIRDKLQESREQAQNIINSGRFSGSVKKLELAEEALKYYEEHLLKNSQQMERGLPRYMYPPHGEILLKKLELLEKLDDNQIDQVMKLVGRIEHVCPDIKKYSQNVSDAVTQITDGVFGTRTEQDARSHGNPLVDNTKVTKVSNGYKNIEPVRAVNNFLFFLSEASRNVIPSWLQPRICFPNGFFGWVAGFVHKVVEVNNFFARICHIDIIGIATFLTQKIQCWVMTNSPHHQVYKGLETAQLNIRKLENSIREQRSFTDPAKKLSADQVKLLAGILDSRKLCSSSLENTHYSGISNEDCQIMYANLENLNLGLNTETREYPPEREAVLKSFQGHQLAANSLDIINGAKFKNVSERSEAVMKLISAGVHAGTNNLQVAVGLGGNQQGVNELFRQGLPGISNVKEFTIHTRSLMMEAVKKVSRIPREYPYDKDTAKSRGISEKLAQTNPYADPALARIQDIGAYSGALAELYERPYNPSDATNTNVSLAPIDRKLLTAADIALRFGGVAIALALQVTSPLILIPSLLLFKPIMTTIRNKLVDNDIAGWIANRYIFKNSGDIGNKTLKFFRSLEHGANTTSMNSAARDAVMAFSELKAFADRALTSPDSAERFSALGKSLVQHMHVVASIALKAGDGVIGPSILYEFEERAQMAIPQEIKAKAKKDGGITPAEFFGLMGGAYNQYALTDLESRYASTTGKEYKKTYENPVYSIQDDPVPMGFMIFYRNPETQHGMTVEQCLNNEVSEFYGLVLDPVKMQQLQSDVIKMAAFRRKVEQWKQEKIEIAKNSDDSLSSHEWKKKLEKHHEKYYEFIKEIVSYTNSDPDQNGAPIISARYQEASMEEAMDWRKKEADYLAQLGLISDDPNDVHPLFDPMVYKGLGMKPETYLTLQARSPKIVQKPHAYSNNLRYSNHVGFTKVARPYIISKEDIEQNGVPDPTYRSKNHVQFIQWSGVENGKPKHWHNESGQFYKPAAQVSEESAKFQRAVALHNRIEADTGVFTKASDGGLGVRVYLLSMQAQLEKVSAKTKYSPPSWLPKPLQKFWGWLFRNREKSLEPAYNPYTNNISKQSIEFEKASQLQDEYVVSKSSVRSPLLINKLLEPECFSVKDYFAYLNEADKENYADRIPTFGTVPPTVDPLIEKFNSEVLNRRIQAMQQKQELTPVA